MGDAAGAGVPCGGAVPVREVGLAVRQPRRPRRVLLPCWRSVADAGHPGEPSAWGRRAAWEGAGALPCGGAVPGGEAGPSEGRRDRKLTQSVAAGEDRLQVRHGGGCRRHSAPSIRAISASSAGAQGSPPGGTIASVSARNSRIGPAGTVTTHGSDADRRVSVTCSSCPVGPSGPAQRCRPGDRRPTRHPARAYPRPVPDPSTYRPAPGTIPEDPGVYRFRDERGRVIYVGKAKSLRQRLNSYFADLHALHPRTRQMVTSAASVEWTVVSTEVEALQLEYNWIKEFDPRFNVRYRDDKSYPSLAVTLYEEYPRLQVMRGAKRKGVRYFGPYAHAWAIRETLDLLLRVFPARTCSAGVFKRAGQIGRPCLLGYIGKCSAPCVGRVTAEEHRAIVDDFCRLHGRQDRPDDPPAGAGDGGGVGGAGVRAGGPAARRPRRAAPGDGEAGGRPRRRHRRRRGRVRRGRAGGRRPGLPRPRRAGARPARLGGRQGRGRHHRRPGRAVLPAGVRRRRRATPCRGRSWCRSCRRTPRCSSSCCGSCAAPGCRCGCRSAATSGRCWRPSPATRSRPSSSTSSSGPPT